MTDISPMHRALVERLLKGGGTASREMRSAAFGNAGLAEPMRSLIDKVAHQAYKVTDEDIAAVRRAGLSEDQIFEIVLCAAVGQATRQYETARAALMAATGRR